MLKRFNNLETNKQFRKSLRNNLTSSEAILWNYLKHSKLGEKFRRQHGIENFVLDFYCPRLRLAIELDGASHDNPQKFYYDKNRDKFLETKQVRVLRIQSKDVYKNLDGVLKEIKKYLQTTFPLTTSPSSNSGTPPWQEERI